VRRRADEDRAQAQAERDATVADRLAARTFAAGRLGPDCLPRLHGQWQQAEEIDFTRLPAGFVLKASRGHACSRLVQASDQPDPVALRQAADRWLAREAGPPPRLFAEALLLARLQLQAGDDRAPTLNALAFSADGLYLASGHAGGELLVWKRGQAGGAWIGTLASTPLRHQAAVRGLASPARSLHG
jgi:hypothetical protein